MIERFHLANFTGHVDTTLELDRLTGLVGDNGSGPSVEVMNVERVFADAAGRSGAAMTREHLAIVRHRQRNGLELDATSLVQLHANPEIGAFVDEVRARIAPFEQP